MNKKYEFTGETKEVLGRTVHRIVAVRNIRRSGCFITKGSLGGWVESEWNLSQDGINWVMDEAVVLDRARVLDNAYVCENAMVVDYAVVCEDALVGGNATVKDDAKVRGNAGVYERARIYEGATVSGLVRVRGKANIHGTTYLRGNEYISGGADISSAKDFMLFANVGHLLGTLTVFKTTSGGLACTYAYFKGTVVAFKKYLMRMCKDPDVRHQMEQLLNIAETTLLSKR